MCLKKNRLRLLLPFLLLWSLAFDAGGQLAVKSNRFQYHAYRWQVLPTPAFHIYFPKGYDSLASLASVQLPDIISDVKNTMGKGLAHAPHIAIYPSIDQLYETNIGIQEQELQTFPTINLKGNRVLVAFNGSYEQFVTQLREAIVRLCWEEQFRRDTEEQLNNNKQVAPAWFKQGCIEYFASGWRMEDEAALKPYFQKDTIGVADSFFTVGRPAGKAFCYFLDQRYRDDAVKQVLFQLRSGKSLSRAVRLITKRQLDTLKEQCRLFFQQRLLEDKVLNDPMPDTVGPWLEKKYGGRIFALHFSPGGQRICFVLQKDNKRKLYVGEVKKILAETSSIKAFHTYRLPQWMEDHAADPYPLVCWEEKGRSLAVLVPQKGKVRLLQYNPQGGFMEDRTLYGVDGVGSFAEEEKGKWLLAAFRKGKSDIVRYDGKKLKLTPLTKDATDHTELSYAPALEEMVYRSGYPADSLYHKDSLTTGYRLYLKETAKDKTVGEQQGRQLFKDSAYIRWWAPKLLPTEKLVLNHNTPGGRIIRDTFPTHGIPIPVIATEIPGPWLRDYRERKHKKDSIGALLLNLDTEEVSVLKDILTPGLTKEAVNKHRDSIRQALAYKGSRVKPYILQLYSAYFSAKINNDYFINRYQPFRAYLGSYKFPEVGAMALAGFSDLFENHHFNIGYRMPAGTEGSDFFVRYENTARRLDWHFLYFRKVESLKPDGQRDWKDAQGNPYPQAAKVKTHYYELGFHYPLQEDWSLQFTTAARKDRTVFLATDRYSLNYEALQQWWSISTLSLSVGKLQSAGIPFLRKGWEGKLLLDGMASTGKESTMLYGTQVSLAWHQPLFSGINLVGRIQSGYSGGGSHMLYNFGGMDQNLVVRTDTAVRFSQEAPYAFQTLVTPFRGYAQNSLYGSRYGLLNLDLYVPLFPKLIPLRTSFSALNNLQLGLLADVAAARPEGLPVNRSSLWAYGFSARTQLAGYPIRFDLAWPGTFSQSPVWYLSLSLK